MLKLCHFLPIMISNSNLFFFAFIVLSVINSSLQVNSSLFDATQNVELDLFLCVDKTKLIFLEYRCDGIPNCPDASDERSCNCPTGQFRASSGYCVSSLIDFVQHRYCHSKNNRRACFKVCQPKEFRCSSAKCIPQSKVCDGFADCDYSIDEWHDCQPQEKKILKHKCAVDELPCYLKTGIRCAKFYEECFYYHQCEVDGCDPNFSCPKKLDWRCFGGPCVTKKSLNDDKADCIGGADETPNAARWKKGLKPSIDSKLGVSIEASSAVYKFAKYILSLFLICAIGVQLYMLKNNSSSRFKRRSSKK
ncbi:low-density lipoprotein receptor-like [Tetranychus urticae]|uniref:low-density lipoprotein receptor-like n=1 Tax=Tetranychus urticae TaxID=32264 RepID=UPI00077BBD3D|nr:low-density lipoprotein receptor-like [Tetranychus urticae]